MTKNLMQLAGTTQSKHTISTSQCSTLVRNTVVRAILQAYGKY